MSQRSLRFFLVSVFLVACGTPDKTEKPTLAIVNGRIFDGTGSQVIANGAVVITGDRITAVGRLGDLDVPGSVQRIDAEGGFVMPGVIDSHVHIMYSPLPRGGDILTPWLEAGVTTLVDVGTIRHTARATKALASQFAEHSPRLFVAGPILTAKGGYPATRSEPDVEMIARMIAGPIEAREAVADLIDLQDVDLIKVAVETGFAADYDDAGWPKLDAEELQAIVRSARERNKPVWAHVSQPGELRAAIAAGVTGAAHTPIDEVPDEILREALDAGVIFISTVNIWRTAHKMAVLDNLDRYRRMGGRVALGTDYPFQEGSKMPLAEMRHLTSAGFSPSEVLVAATQNGALALGVQDDLGTLAAGKLADIIVVAGNPTENIGDLENVRTVIRNGEVIRKNKT